MSLSYRGHQFNYNEDYPYWCTGVDAPPLPEARIDSSFTSYYTQVYNADGSTFVDHNNNRNFLVIEPHQRTLSNQEVINTGGGGSADIAFVMEPAEGNIPAQYGSVGRARILNRKPTMNGSLAWVLTSKLVAIKLIELARVPAEPTVDNPFKEISVLQYLTRYIQELNQNPLGEEDGNLTILQLIERAEQSMRDHHVITLIQAFSNSTHLCMVMPFCNGGDLYNEIVSRKKDVRGYSEAEAKFWLKKMLDCIETLQKAEICHKDISFENMMLSYDDDGEPNVVVIDFGMALKIPFKEHSGRRRRCRINRSRPSGKVSLCTPILSILNNFVNHPIFRRNSSASSASLYVTRNIR